MEPSRSTKVISMITWIRTSGFSIKNSAHRWILEARRGLTGPEAGHLRPEAGPSDPEAGPSVPRRGVSGGAGAQRLGCAAGTPAFGSIFKIVSSFGDKCLKNGSRMLHYWNHFVSIYRQKMAIFEN